MKVISRSKIAEDKIKSIRLGYTAFAESQEVLNKIKKELVLHDIDFIEETTDVGSWITPKKKA
ncbi:hypothetical protein CR203_12805 [Salipaludibacillus neizhouensis]|uniref:Uncharacterized protein n=1 Tax=Salipaludibacillus neizhouensis TaxID=885475 RepID=A0A3A9K0T5_9BACI|nr:hypothetical protein [Salipaludibacillus neizhouensis]RKL66714.1 hypothetical protein CR203_12805 [Salipaludibacillus neizhouensis]